LKSHGWYIAAAALALFVLAAVLIKLGGILLRRAKTGLPLAGASRTHYRKRMQSAEVGLTAPIAGRVHF
jgi:hypothetical protein